MEIMNEYQTRMNREKIMKYRFKKDTKLITLSVPNEFQTFQEKLFNKNIRMSS